MNPNLQVIERGDGRRFLQTENVARMGWRPTSDRNAAKARRPDARVLLASRHGHEEFRAVALPAQYTMEALFGAFFDQGMSGSCTAASTNKACRLTLVNKGIMPFPDASPRFTYGTTRQIERAATVPEGQDVPPLEDTGCEPEDCITSVETGIIAMSPASTPDGRYYDLWTPEDVSGGPANINDEAGAGDDVAAAAHILTGAHDVDIWAPDLQEQLQAICCANIGSTMAWFVDTQNVMGWDPSKGPIGKIDLNDPQGGGHQTTCVVGYRVEGARFVIRFGNSWGMWGDKGFGEIYLDALLPALSAIVAYDVSLAPPQASKEAA